MSSSEQSGPVTRKYVTEYDLQLSIMIRSVLPAKELYSEDAESDDPRNLYLICKQPKVIIRPDGVESRGVTVDGRDLVLFRGKATQLSTEPSDVEFVVWTESDGPLKWASFPPYDNYEIRTNSGAVFKEGNFALLQLEGGRWFDELWGLSVVYVGQSFGSRGEKDAVERLRKHSTLQRIVTEAKDGEQVWILTASVFNRQAMIESDGRVEVLASDDEDDEHIATVSSFIESDTLTDKLTVDIAEACLIAYFQPAYNQRLKKDFPGSHKMLMQLRELDFRAIGFENKLLVDRSRVNFAEM